ncbi:hypothetical protein PV331_45070 [Streptomyces sp. WI04-05B]|nr:MULTISPECIES: hypothetical protein [unclassified Streptomyces]MDX2548955.1 hypothetical protein [Streptomyces sp. WI04-05B]MDX2589265.1 hypothetical protein [Streptomyces sp. WI04-05A]
MPRTAIAGAVATVEALVPEDDGSAEAAMREKLALRYNTVRPFLSLLGESDALGASPAGRRVLAAVRLGVVFKCHAHIRSDARVTAAW